MKKIKGSGNFFDHYLGKYGGKLLFRSNLKQQDSTLLNLKDPLLKEIIQHWTKFNYKDDNLDFASTYIWYNSHIRSQGKWLEERDIHCNLSIIVNWENTHCRSFIFSVQESQSLEHPNLNSFTEK